MSPELINNEGENLERVLTLRGRTLWLTEDPQLLRKQLDGSTFDFIPQDQLAANVSTDEIIPSEYCFYFTPEELGDFALTGFRNNVVQPGDIKRGKFDIIVAGSLFGGGSAREHAPLSLRGAGIRFIAGNLMERIFLANSQNQGLYPITSSDILEKLLEERSISLNRLVEGLDQISADIVLQGGLLPYLQAKSEGRVVSPEIKTDPRRPMTMTEKIVARHWIMEDKNSSLLAVKPGDTGFIKPDFTYSYEIMTPLVEAILEKQFGQDFHIVNKENIALFEDHLVLYQPKAKLEEQRNLQALHASRLITSQRRFARNNEICRYNPDVGICHNVVSERHVLPGEVVSATDSHTCSQGAVGAFAIGVGATDMAGTWITGDVRVTVPKTWRFNFNGRLGEKVMTKDIMLYIFSKPEFKKGNAVGKVLEFSGKGLEALSFDELFVMPNMAVDGGAFTGIVEPNNVVINFLLSNHPELSRQQIKNMILKSDEDAEFDEIFDIDLSEISPMAALPGNPKNGVPLDDVRGIRPDVIYIGSCTGGKFEDLERVASSLKGQKVKIPTFVQANSILTRLKAQREGIIDIIINSGAELIDPGCGDCCNLGQGIASEGELILSDTNRNFPGRMGKANVILVNPQVAAEAAVNGFI